MISSEKGMAPITSGASSHVDAFRTDRFERRGYDLSCPEPGEFSAVTTLSRADRPLVVSARKPPRILLVDAALALHELHLELLRSTPAIVETLASCADLYLHEGDAYALVILGFHPQSRETPEVAHFVRHRWSVSRILLLQSESAVIDDWLYDERVDPHSHPATVCEAAIRLMTEEKY
jgi:hypothetical protein